MIRKALFPPTIEEIENVEGVLHMLLKDKIGLVTGGGDGIGRATAIMFAKDGAKVAVADVRPEAAEETVTMIEQLGGQAIAVTADVSQAESVEAMVGKTMAAFGSLDCVSNNAAGGGGFKLTPDVDEHNWDRCQNITLKGVWLCLKYQIPAMLQSGGGAIVNIASLSGVRGEALQSPL
ncbi:MAG: SDR family NAD(P)-dependent oxidoreductase [Pseudomonadales bacterium]